jgi:hypothetical protein
MLPRPNQSNYQMLNPIFFMVTSTYDTLPSFNMIWPFTLTSQAQGVAILHANKKKALQHVEYLQDDKFKQKGSWLGHAHKTFHSPIMII